MSENAAERLGTIAPRIEYLALPPGAPLPPDALFAVDFSAHATPTAAASARARVGLEPLAGAGITEVWRATGPVHRGFAGPIRFAADDHYLAGAIEVDEAEHGGIAGAAEYGYRVVNDFQASSRHPHLLRIWNYLDAINDGAGDAERYRIFCQGRAAGIAPRKFDRYPAATAIGRRDGVRSLQIYWLAGRQPGIAIENPRQISAFRYPRKYGPVAPTFSRAMLVAPGLLMISGTASIVGHATLHHGDAARQFAEIMNNLDTLLARARAHDPTLPARFTRQTLFKAYVRHPEDLPMVQRELKARLPSGTPFLVLVGDVCRADLRLELDCLHAAG